MAIDPYALPVPDLGLCCRHCGYILTGLPEHRCAECGRAFDMDEFVPAGAYPRLYAEGRPVQPTPRIEALLQEHGIPYTSPLEALDQMFGFTFSAVGRPSLSVARPHYWEAVDLVRRHWHDQPMPEPPAELQAEGDNPGQDWPCPSCSEENPGNFDVCWSCGGGRE